MSGAPGRRGQSVNMSQYIQNLNEVRKDSPPEENMTTLEEELAIFTNTNFIDWDANNGQATSPVNTKTPRHSVSGTPVTNHRSKNNNNGNNNNHQQTQQPIPTGDANMGDMDGFEFHLDGYGFDFNPYTPNAVPAFAESIGSLQPIQPSPAYGSGPAAGQPRPYGAPPQPAPAHEKKKSESQPRGLNFEEQSRLAAEEDKRRRNTAASARFRVKKKAREQALEKSQKELSDKVGSLEARIHSLETENKWLRELVMEKNGGNENVVAALIDKQREKDEARNRAAVAGR